MSNTRRRLVWIVVILVVVVLGGGGCYMIGGKMFSSNAGQDMLRYMEEKYGEEFVGDTLNLANYLDGYDRLFCHPKWGTLEQDRVTVKRFKEDGGYWYADTYFSIIIRDEVEQRVKEICKEVSVDADVYYISADYYDKEFNHSKTFQDVIDSGEYIGMIVEIIIEDQDGLNYNAVQRGIFDNLKEKHMQGLYTVIFLPKSEKEKITRENIREIPSVSSDKFFEEVLAEGDEQWEN